MPLGVTDKLAKLIYERDGYHCARCGRPAPAYKRQLHHRKPRGMGGRKDNSVDFPENIVLLCGASSTDPDSCHHYIERFRNLARADGWLLYENDDPREVPILARDGQRHYLVDDQWDPMLLPVSVARPRPKIWSRGAARNAKRPEWLAVHGGPNAEDPQQN